MLLPIVLGATVIRQDNLYRAWSLTQAGTLLLNITGEDLSLEAESVKKFGSDYDGIQKRRVTV